MGWVRCVNGDGSFGNIIPMSFVGEYHNFQSNRTITIEDNTLSSPITSQTNCVGILSMPVTMPIGADCLLVKYKLQAPSYIGGGYSATIFCSDTQMTGLTDRTSSYGNKVLTEKALSTGDTDYFYDAIDFPSTASYFNIQLGTSNFESLEFFAISRATINDIELITNPPLVTIPITSSGAGYDTSWEHSVNLGTGFNKVRAILAYYGPGASAGQVLGGSVSFSINGSAVLLKKVITERDETLAKALEYWEADISAATDVQTVETHFSGYNYNAGTRISLILWILK